MAHVFRTVDVGHVLPGIGDEARGDGRIRAAAVRVGLLDMDDGRVRIVRLAEGECDDAVVEPDGTALELEIRVVVEYFKDGLALPGDEGVVRFILQAQLVPVVELNLAGRDNVVRDG